MSEGSSEPRFLQWQSVSALSNNHISRVAAMIPVIGYLLLYNDQIADALEFTTLANGKDTFILSSGQKLRLSFVGSCALLIANLGSVIGAPKVLNGASSDIQFADKVIDSYSLSEIQEMDRAVMSETWIQRTPDTLHEDSYLDVRNSKSTGTLGFRFKQELIGNNRHMRSGAPEYIRSIAREWWAGEMHNFPILRYACLAFAISGFSMLALPSLDILQAVLRTLL
ncbi:MAG: hypothetical protein VX083_08725 [Pseudomonadota bacterium]|nr:hypothetical protein [Pseudomonadota bacterium]